MQKKYDTEWDKPLWGLRVDGPLGRRFLRGLSLTAALPLRVVVGAIWTSPAGLRVDGPLGRRFLRGLSLTRLWREGCCRAPMN